MKKQLCTTSSKEKFLRLEEILRNIMFKNLIKINQIIIKEEYLQVPLCLIIELEIVRFNL